MNDNFAHGTFSKKSYKTHFHCFLARDSPKKFSLTILIYKGVNTAFFINILF